MGATENHKGIDIAAPERKRHYKHLKFNEKFKRHSIITSFLSTIFQKT